MLNKKLYVNQKIEIQVDDLPYKGRYLSKISEVNEDNIKVLSPFFNGEIVPLRFNTPVSVLFTGDNAIYQFFTKVVGRDKEPVALHTLEAPKKFFRIQRREFFRVDASIGVKYRLLKKSFDEEELRETVTLDISGGGIKMIVDEGFPGSGLIEVYLDIPEIKEIPIKGKIVNSYDYKQKKGVGIEFIAIDNRSRDLIISWLFDYQRKLRKKGLL